MSKNAYVVIGSTGEYSSTSEWIVAVYSDEDMAKNHAEMAESFAKTIFDPEDPKQHDNRHKRKMKPNPFDKKMEMDYTGTYYRVEVARFREELPKVSP